MTTVAAVAFPDEVIILSDSRVSYKNSVKKSEDKLKKIYQLGKHLMIAYTSEDVTATCLILNNITRKIQSEPSKKTSELLHAVSEYVRDEYAQLDTKPTMKFLFAGMELNSKLSVETRKLTIALKRIRECGGFVPKIIQDTQINPKKKKTVIHGSAPILGRLSFPDGKLIITKGWDMGTAGAGASFVEKLAEMYPKIFSFPGGFNKAVIIKNMCDDFIKEAQIDTVGGFVQVFLITKDGVSPLQYLESKNGIETSKRYIDSDGSWIEEDSNSGSKKKIVQNL